ncbi:DUF4956 domain-containing protein [Candidatus Sulfidibacterium hydrothermale]|uniref:DUF4956 domain-containing protein n=1 Tax=Candidatus Sulfidibacterium hydrothermale TaxID=2875962 RepID=UPI001F0ADE55|nr:DUF4956 domain-containing protein [Candidatus Sulfidibacterium hydrothermale]UBM63278.1 DUF4956 domain-containing protein [Candidatus Sulfidibacterium hydrothermale]
MNDKWNLFQKFLITQNQNLSITEFLINSAVIIILILALEYTYIRCARSISNRRQFAGVFLLIAFTTMLIITIVKSSLALSLGLVGALSIVRFRAAIKEPEELAYLFLAISIGLGLGANQTLITAVATAVALVIIWGRHLFRYKKTYQNVHLNFSAKAGDAELKEVTALVQEVFGKYVLTRYDENGQVMEASFVIDTPNAEKLQTFKEKADKFGKALRISFVESKSF